MLYHSEPITRNLVISLTTLMISADRKEEMKAQVETITLEAATKEERESYFRLAAPTLMNWGALGVVFAGLCFGITLFEVARLTTPIVLGLAFAASMFILGVMHNQKAKASMANPEYMPSFSTSNTVLGFLGGILISLLFVQFVLMPLLPLR